MHFIYLLGRIYPFWALPLIVIAVEVGIFFKRKKSKIQYYFWAAVFSLSLGILIWLLLRGDRYSDRWIHSLFSLVP